MDFLVDLLPFAFLALYFLSRLGRRARQPGRAPGTTPDADASVPRETPGSFSLEDMLRRLEEAANPPPAPLPADPSPVPRASQTVRPKPPGRFAQEGPSRVRKPEPPPPPAAPTVPLGDRLRRPEAARDAFIFTTVFERRRPGRRPGGRA